MRKREAAATPNDVAPGAARAIPRGGGADGRTR